MKKQKQLYLNVKARTVRLTVDFKYKQGSLVPDEIIVDGSKCTVGEMMMALARIYATIHDEDPAFFIASTLESLLEDGINKGVYKIKGAKNA